MPGINRDEIENAVLSYLETLLTKETVGEITTWITANAKLYRKNAATEIKALKKEITEADKEANAILDKILDGMDSEIARQRLADAEARKLRLEIKLTDMQIRAETTTEVSKTQVKAYLSQLKGIRKLTREEQARVIRQFIDRIDIYDPPDGGGKEIKIKTKLDGLLSDVRIEKEAALLDRENNSLVRLLFLLKNRCQSGAVQGKNSYTNHEIQAPLRYLYFIQKKPGTRRPPAFRPYVTPPPAASAHHYCCSYSRSVSRTGYRTRPVRPR